MKIGIDISQSQYEGTGVAQYLDKLIAHLLQMKSEHEYVLFFSSLRKTIQKSKFTGQNYNSKVKIINFRLPPTLLDVLWNRLHIAPIEWFIGDVDVFISSDWTQPPVKKGKNFTILYDLIIYKYPEETDQKIIMTQKRRLKWVKKECDKIICISEATKKDAINILGIDEKRLEVIFPGI